jgi:hypothetical protein
VAYRYVVGVGAVVAVIVVQNTLEFTRADWASGGRRLAAWLPLSAIWLETREERAMRSLLHALLQLPSHFGWDMLKSSLPTAVQSPVGRIPVRAPMR